MGRYKTSEAFGQVVSKRIPRLFHQHRLKSRRHQTRPGSLQSYNRNRIQDLNLMPMAVMSIRMSAEFFIRNYLKSYRPNFIAICIIQLHNI